MWYVRDVLYAVLYVRVICFVVRGCGVSRRYIEEEINFIETHDSYKKLRQKYCLYNYEIVYTL